MSMTSLGSAPPATLTRISIFSQRSSVARTISCTDFLLVTSTTTVKASPPWPVISTVRCLALSGWMSATAIFAPSRAKWREMPRLMPPLQPVTIATVFSNDAMDSDTSRCLPVLAAGLSFEIDKQFVEILNSLHARMIERLIIGAMRHEHDRFGVFCYIAAVLMSIIDEHVDV